MKKKLLTLCSILLIIGCSKAEPQQEEELTVVKSSVTTESMEVAGASYNPNVQDGGELEESVMTVPEDTISDSKEPMKEVTPATTTKKPYTPKQEPKKEVIEVSEEEVDMAIVETVAVKIKEDEKISKSTQEKETLVGETTKPIEEEEPKQKSLALWVMIGAIAAGAGAFFLKKK